MSHSARAHARRAGIDDKASAGGRRLGIIGRSPDRSEAHA